ncbi:MAG: sensor histidine kinase [Parasphingopyxis sp.]|nr:histidine kinase [Sphingomonadales bacterium]
MDGYTTDSRRPASIGSRLGLISIAGLWGFYFLVITLRSVVMFDEQTVLLIYRIIVTAFAIGATYLLFLFLERFAALALRWRIPIAFAAALPVAAAIAGFNFYIIDVVDPMNLFDSAEMAAMREEQAESIARDPWIMYKWFAESVMSRYFVVIAWSLLYMALGYAQIVRGAERRAAIFAQEAQTAQLRALRYQVNPHFLFNTLNVLSSLVMRDRREEAEKMIINLSTFFRTSLTAEPTDDVTLAEEIHLQELYLDIEMVRFPERLKIDIQVPRPLASACVPAMLLQPLVENSIKYGVSRVRRPVTVSIHAEEQDGKLVLRVFDDGEPLAWDAPGGTGVGLVNVRERLEARYGDESSVTWGPRDEGGFAVELVLPINRESC